MDILIGAVVAIVFVTASFCLAGEISWRHQRKHSLKNAWEARQWFDGQKYIEDARPALQGIVRDKPDAEPILFLMEFLEKGIFLRRKSAFPSPFRHSLCLFLPWAAVRDYKPIKLPPLFYVSNLVKKEDSYVELRIRKTSMTLILSEKYLEQIKGYLPPMQLEFY